MRRIAYCLLTVLLAACSSEQAARDLDRLVLLDSTYIVPETGAPYSGPVFRVFADDPAVVQIEGVLTDGLWNGEIRVFHDNGRIRYEGGLAMGEKCGPWIENRDAEQPEDILAELKQEVESMGIYPPCPSG